MMRQFDVWIGPHLHIAPVDGPPPSAGMFVVCWPEDDGDGRYLVNAHPDRSVMDSEAGDVLVMRGQGRRFRMVGGQRFNDWDGPWYGSVRECLSSGQVAPATIRP